MFGRKADLNKDIGKKSSGTGNAGGLWIKRMEKGQNEITVRPLTEPDTWVVYTQVWDKGIQRGWPLPDGEYLADGQEGSNKYLAPLLDVENDRVMAFQVPKSVFDKFGRRYQRHGTVMNRDWMIVREGSGLDTEYDLEEDLEIDRDLSKYEVPELEDVLRDAHEHAVEEGWTTSGVQLDKVTTEAPAKKAPAKKAPAKKAPVDDSEEEEPTTDMDADELAKLPLGKLRSMARDQNINPSGLSKKEIIDAITGMDAF